MFTLHGARRRTLQTRCRRFHIPISYRSERGSQPQCVLAASCGLLWFSQGSEALSTLVRQSHCFVWQQNVLQRTTGPARQQDNAQAVLLHMHSLQYSVWKPWWSCS